MTKHTFWDDQFDVQKSTPWLTLDLGSSGKGKNWNVGDLLGRDKKGFKPLNTEEEGMLDDDSDSEVIFNVFFYMFHV